MVLQSETVLLQNERDNSDQKIITKCNRIFLQSSLGIIKCDRLLQIVSGIKKYDRLLLQSGSGITKWDSYIKVRRNSSQFVSLMLEIFWKFPPYLYEKIFVTTQACNQEFFRGRRNFLDLGHFDKRSFYNTKKKGSAGKNLRVFPPRNSYNLHFKWEISPTDTIIRVLFPRIRIFFSNFWKRTGESPSPSSL